MRWLCILILFFLILVQVITLSTVLSLQTHIEVQELTINLLADKLADNRFASVEQSGEIASLHCKTDALASISRVGWWYNSAVDSLRNCNLMRRR